MSKLDWEKANKDKGSPGELSSSSSHYNAAVAHSIARKKRMAREAANLRKHNQALAEGKVPDFNRGMMAGRLDERSRIIRLLAETKDQTLCTCHGCEEWLNALDYIIARIENKIHD